MLKWKRQNGRTLITNEEQATVEHCESMGWEKIGIVLEIIEPVVSEDLKPDSHRKPLVDDQTSGEIGQGDPDPESIDFPKNGPKPAAIPKKIKAGKIIK